MGRYLVLFSFILFLQTCNCYGSEDIEEYYLKAVFIEKFTQFTEWDNIENDKEFIIEIIGENPFKDKFAKVFKDKKVKNKNVVIKEITAAEQIGKPHILFISKSKEKQLKEILDKTKDKNILTLSDSPDFAKKGVIINFFLQDTKIRFEINVPVLEKTKLKISYKLLQLAVIVK